MRAECIVRLVKIGIAESDAWKLRRIAMTLHRWHERECGTDGGCIERDETTQKPYWLSSYQRSDGRCARWPIPDRETGARKRLAKVMAAYPDLSAYIQGDPRGAALYILRPGDVPKGEPVDSFYSRGIAVYA